MLQVPYPQVQVQVQVLNLFVKYNSSTNITRRQILVYKKIKNTVLDCKKQNMSITYKHSTQKHQ